MGKVYLHIGTLDAEKIRPFNMGGIFEVELNCMEYAYWALGQ